jgi:hypothetical protein
MVFSGAPLFMWVHAIKAAAFINNITATFYAKVGVWATPYELVHGERFPDASVVVPFGCAALILLDDDEQAKFKSRCVLMIFMHYADRHPLFTYAFYSPKTKRVVFRQDCIFLPTLFPMRQARSQAGMNPDGERLVAYRSPGIMRDGPPGVSFQNWSESDPLPSFDDDVSGFELYSQGCFPSPPPNTLAYSRGLAAPPKMGAAMGASGARSAAPRSAALGSSRGAPASRSATRRGSSGWRPGPGAAASGRRQTARKTDRQAGGQTDR